MMYNPLGRNWIDAKTLQIACKLYGDLCELSISMLSGDDPSIDNFDRLQDFLKMFPSGSSYLDVILTM